MTRETDDTATLAAAARRRAVAEALAARDRGDLAEANRIIAEAAAGLPPMRTEKPLEGPESRETGSAPPSAPNGPTKPRAVRGVPDDGGFVEEGSDHAEDLRSTGAARHVIAMIHDTCNVAGETSVPIASNAPPRKCPKCKGTAGDCPRCHGTGLIPVGWEGPLGRMLKAEFRRDPDLRVDEVVAAIMGEVRRRRRPFRLTSTALDELIGASRRGPYRRVTVHDARRGAVIVEQGETKFRPEGDDDE